MTFAKAWILLLAATLLVPLGAGAGPASDGLRAESLRFAGATTLESDTSALFFILRDADAVNWRLSAQGGTLERAYLVEAAVDNPLNPENYLYSHELDSGVETLDLGAVTLASTGGQEGGALLAQGSLLSSSSSDGLILVTAVTNPTVAQFGEADVAPGEGVGIEETLPGDLLAVEVAHGSAILRGDMVLTLFGPWYSLDDGGAVTDHKTGEFESDRAGPATQVHQEKHTQTLRDAVLELSFVQPVELFATHATVDVAGTIEAADAEGEMPDGLTATSAATWSGGALLELGASSGRVTAAGPQALSSTAAVVAVPRVPFLVAAALAVGALGAVAVLALRRRARGDDIELALLAMEERRWQDALPHLTRVARRRPDDAGVQIDRALCLEQVGRFEEAAKAFEAALRAAPRHAEAHFYYARTLAKMQEKEAARVHLETALERDPRLVEMMRGEPVLKGL